MQNDYIREDEAVEEEAALDDYEPEMLSGRNSSVRGRHSAHGPSSTVPLNDLPESHLNVSLSSIICIQSWNPQHEALDRHFPSLNGQLGLSVPSEYAH